MNNNQLTIENLLKNLILIEVEEKEKKGTSTLEKYWKEILKYEISENDYKDHLDKYINTISDSNEHMLNVIFDAKINPNNSDIKINPKFNYKGLLKSFTKIEHKISNSYILLPIFKSIEYFEKINKEMALDKEDWERVINLKSIKPYYETINSKLVRKLENLNKDIVNKEDQQKFITEIVEPLIEKMESNMDYYNSTELLFTVIRLMLKEKIPKIKDHVVKKLINKGGTNICLESLVEHDNKNKENKKTYLNYISEDNVQLMINKVEPSSVLISNLYIEYEDSNVIEKKLRDNFYKKVLRTPEAYLQVYLNVKDTGWSEEFINEQINDISKSNIKSEKILEYWINNSLEKTVINPKLKNILNDKHINSLIGGLRGNENQIGKYYKGIYYNTIANESEIGFKLLLKIKDKELYKYGIKVPYLKDLLNKSSETNEYLLDFYLNKSFDGIIDIKEKELLEYVKNSPTNTYKEKFFKQCFNIADENKKKTGSLLSFSIDLVNIDESKDLENIVKTWFFQIRSEPKKNIKIDNFLKLSATDIENVINNRKLLNAIGNSVFSSIGKIEKLWNITINKEKLINTIDINKISFLYENINEEIYVPVEKANDYGVILSELDKMHLKFQKENVLVQKKKIFNFWNELLEIDKTSQKEIFSIEEIKKILNKIDIQDLIIRKKLVNSLFDDKSYKFLKYLIKKDEIFFEGLITKVINEVEGDELTIFTNNLLKLKIEVEFNEELIMQGYNKSNQKEIEPELIKKAQIISLMEEKELNNIDIANNLISKNKDNFYKLGKQLIEFLQLDKDNTEKELSKYNEKNIEGLFGYFKRKEKESLQEKINKAIEYNNKQQLNSIEIKAEVEKINISRLYEEEKEQVEKIINKLMTINKDILKELPLTENTELKKCMEITFIGIIKTYSKISDNDKRANPELMENFKDIMNYCEAQIDKVIPNVQIIKPKI